MFALVTSLLWGLIITILIARAIGQSRRFVSVSRDTRPVGPLPSVEVIVPARNEAATISRCLSALQRLTYPRDHFGVTVVDDRSADATASIIEGFVSHAANLHLVKGLPLPPGWFGKSYACWQGAQTADAEWLCFIDADTRPAPEILDAALGFAQRRHLDMLSFEPFQELGGFWERLILPTGFLVMAFFRDCRRFEDETSKVATANGQFILIRRAVYEMVGGHRAVRGEIAEDSRLAQSVKRAGYRVALVGGDQLIHTRMYTGLRPLWEGLSKHAVELAGGVALLLVYVVMGVGLGIGEVALPVWTWARLAVAPAGSVGLLAALSATAGTLALFGIHAGTLRHFRASPAYALLAPMSYVMIMLIAANSLVERSMGRMIWKGRIYSVSGWDGRPQTERRRKEVCGDD